MPHVAYAETFDQFISNVYTLIVNPLILFLFALATAYFLYGAAKFFFNQENEEKRSEGKKHMIYGIIGMAVMMGVFTILNIIISTFGIKGVNPSASPSGQVDLPDWPTN